MAVTCFENRAPGLNTGRKSLVVGDHHCKLMTCQQSILPNQAPNLHVYVAFSDHSLSSANPASPVEASSIHNVNFSIERPGLSDEAGFAKDPVAGRTIRHFGLHDDTAFHPAASAHSFLPCRERTRPRFPRDSAMRRCGRVEHDDRRCLGPNK